MKTVSFEYAHIYPGKNEKEAIKEANEWAVRAYKSFDGMDVQKCLMIDDIHADRKIDEEYLENIVSQLELKPDCIYAESEFIMEAHKMVEGIDRGARDFIYSEDRIWLREKVDQYKFSGEFMLGWKKKGEMQFSCPSLAATSYLTRLGSIEADGVNVLWGEPLKKSDYVFNVLSSEFLQVEDKAQSVIEAVDKTALRKIGWFFY